MIQCIVLDKQTVIDQLSKQLNQELFQHWPHAKIILETNIPYWKRVECKQVIYSVTTWNPCVIVQDFIKHFEITWHYTDYETSSTVIDQCNHNQEAIWSKLSNPSELFLISEVEWAHIYTWDKDE